MSMNEHRYSQKLVWTGDRGTGTSAYRAYERAHTIAIEGKPDLLGSSDPGFRGDSSRHNPEDLFVASIAACHMLWYLGLCAASGVVVRSYVDRPEGIMIEEEDGAGRFTCVTLRPDIGLAPGSDLALATELNHDAHRKCFIANSISVPIVLQPTFAWVAAIGSVG